MLVYSWFLIFVIFNTEAWRILTNQSKNVQFSNRDYNQGIQTLSKPIEELTNKADDLRKSNTKHNIFIDIETLRPIELRRIERAKEYMHHRHLKKRKIPQFDDSFTVKSAMSSFKSLSTKVKFGNQIYLRRSPMVFAKVLTSLPNEGIHAKFDNRKQYTNKRSNRNQTRDRFNIKKKVLTQLQRLENDIKAVKAQIDNDTRTIEGLQNQLRQKEKQRAKLKLMNEKTTILLNTIIEKPAIKMLAKSLYNGTITTTDKNENHKFNFDENTQTKTTKNQVTNEKKDIQTNSSDSHELYKYRRHSNITTRDYVKGISKNIDNNKFEGDDLHEDFYIDEIKENENTLNSTSKAKYDTNYIKIYKNISNEENVDNTTVSTPRIFDLHEDFETFERFDGEFDWEKFITSEMYIQIIKNSTAEPTDFRRMLTDEKKAGVTVSDLSEAVTTFEEKIWDYYYLERPITVHPQFVPFKSNNSKTSLVPRPSRQKSFLETITLPEIEKSLNVDTDNNMRYLGMRHLNNPRKIPGGQYPIIDGRRNMPTLPTILTTADQILYDAIIRDIDKDIEI